jgi:hypothetical protein
MSTDPSTVDIHASGSWQPPWKRFLAAEERAHAENAKQRGERSDCAIRSQSLMGAAAKYPAAVTCASHRLTCRGQPQVDHRDTPTDQTERQGVVLRLTGNVTCMAGDWLLVETLGREPAVVALGRQLRNLVPMTVFLRRNPRLAAIQSAIAESLQTSQSLVSMTLKNDRVIRTEPVLMSDGRIHGVHIWSGPAGAEPPERPIPGPLKWNMTLGIATDTPESLANSGRNLEIEATEGRAFAQSWPSGDLKPNEGKALAAAVRSEPGHTLCDTWDSTDWQGNHIRVSFVARNRLEPGPDGRDHVIARGMNWRAEPVGRPQSADRLAQQILHGLAQPGVHRALFDPHNWTMLKWLDEPCPFYDWRRIAADAPRMHPSDQAKMAAMTAEFARGATSGVLRMPGYDGEWVAVHVTVSRVEVEQETFAGLVALRLPTHAELADAGLPDHDPTRD